MPDIRAKIESICSDMVLSESQLQEISKQLQEEIEKGLSKERHAESCVKCFPTYVRRLPTGRESGKFLALDLGGTNFRVLVIELGLGSCSMKSKIFAIPQSIMTGTGTQLFDHIAECLSTFMKEQGIGHGERLPLGFTFSFPCSQEGLKRARLVTWTKGFNCAGVEGEDVVQLLQEALQRRGEASVDIAAILNDTTGTLMSCAHRNPNCRVGLIVGTGTNACYVERLEKVEMIDSAEISVDGPGPDQVVINTEWGAFGDNGCIDFVRTQYDKEIDENSLNPGKQLYEKMISGMYMGELARLVLVRLTKEGLLFGGRGSDLLFERGKFFTKYISEIESDRRGDYVNCMEILEELGLIGSDGTEGAGRLPSSMEADCENVRYVCEVVSRRAAYLAGAGVATLLNRMGEGNVTVAVDGSVYRFHPHFHQLMVEQIRRMVHNVKFDLMLSEDGSGRGAALVAAVSCGQQQHM